MNDKKKFKAALVCLLREVRPFDIEMFRDLIGNYDEQVDKIKGADIYLLLGGTGVGKSTLIHYLSGSVMKFDTSAAAGGMKHITFDKLSANLTEEGRK